MEPFTESLTESVVTRSLGEWNGRGMEEEWRKSCVAASAESSSYVTREARHDSATATRQGIAA